jgi:tRNA (adenine37-N6)-methyltransferase
VLDIKPYLPYADALRGAKVAWAAEPIVKRKVLLATTVRTFLRAQEITYPGITALVRELVGLDPRPAFQQRQHPMEDPKSVGRRYGFALYGFDVKWEITAKGPRVWEVVVLQRNGE